MIPHRRGKHEERTYLLVHGLAGVEKRIPRSLETSRGRNGRTCHYNALEAKKGVRKGQLTTLARSASIDTMLAASGRTASLLIWGAYLANPPFAVLSRHNACATSARDLDRGSSSVQIEAGSSGSRTSSRGDGRTSGRRRGRRTWRNNNGRENRPSRRGNGSSGRRNWHNRTARNQARNCRSSGSRRSRRASSASGRVDGDERCHSGAENNEKRAL